MAINTDTSFSSHVVGANPQPQPSASEAAGDAATSSGATVAAGGNDAFSTAEGSLVGAQVAAQLGIADPDSMAEAQRAFEALPSEQKTQVRQFAQRLSGQLGQQQSGLTQDIESEWRGVVSDSSAHLREVNALVQEVLREAYMENTKDLHAYAKKVKFYNEVKKAVRQELQRARERLPEVINSDADNPSLNPPFIPKEINTNYHGQTQVDVKQNQAGYDEAAAAYDQARAQFDAPTMSPAEIKETLDNGGEYTFTFNGEQYTVRKNSGHYEAFDASGNKIDTEVQVQGDLTVQGYMEVGGVAGIGSGERLYIGGSNFSMRVATAELDANDDNRDEHLQRLESNDNRLADTQAAQTELETVKSNLGVASNKKELENYIQQMEDKLNSVGEDAQLANVDLQNMMQKQQQTLQTLSNVSKSLHDTAQAVIRKMG